ncbi:MAG TPA: DUF433 domain-containing protein [Blastocatellia bacterium]
MSTTVSATHIEIDDKGVAWITGTNTKVIEIVLDRIAHGWSPEEIHFQHPHLTLAEIHSALAYFYDHQEKLDAEIDRRRREANEVATKASDPAFRKRLIGLRNRR